MHKKYTMALSTEIIIVFNMMDTKMNLYTLNIRLNMLKKFLPLISIPLLFLTLLSPIATPALGIVSILFSIAIALYAIFEKWKQTENPRPKIIKDILILLLTLLLIIFLGGVAGLFANGYAPPRFGVAVGFISAIAISFVLGYFVKKGIARLIE